MSLGDIAKKFEAFGFDAYEVDGHDCAAIGNVIDICKANGGRPQAVVLHTIKGKGVSFAERAGTANHNMPVSAEQLAQALEDLSQWK
jgi:transketolase